MPEGVHAGHDIALSSPQPAFNREDDHMGCLKLTRRTLFALAALVVTQIFGPFGIGEAADRPPVMGRNGGVSAGHPLTTAAAFEILVRGGNAFDAGVAALLVGGVVEQDLYSLGGEALVLVFPRSENKVTAIVGQGWASQNASIESYEARGKTLDGQ